MLRLQQRNEGITDGPTGRFIESLYRESASYRYWELKYHARENAFIWGYVW